MLALIDTVIGFTVIILLLSFLVKSLTSVVKNHVQYYSQNLQRELVLVLRPLVGVTLDRLESALGGIDWRNVGEELLDEENLKPVLEKIDSGLDLADLKARLAVHKAALKFAFDRRMKNLSLACGAALCLLLNINAFTIWTTVYQDGDVRAKFTSEAYVTQVLERAAEDSEEDPPEDQVTDPTAEGAIGPEEAANGKAELEKSREEWKKELETFRAEVDFGVGAIWTATNPAPKTVFYELIGSLLTGFLASIGAPYLHDMLIALSSFRKL